jgi:hypothetical protein
LIFSAATSETFITPAEFTWTPEKAPDGPVSIIVSTKDRTGYVYRNGVEIGRAAIRGVERISGTHIYAALETVAADGKRNWISKASVGGRAPNLSDLANQVKIAPEFLSHARALITPGTTLILTDAPVSDKTRSGPGFNILTAAQKK